MSHGHTSWWLFEFGTSSGLLTKHSRLWDEENLKNITVRVYWVDVPARQTKKTDLSQCNFKKPDPSYRQAGYQHACLSRLSKDKLQVAASWSSFVHVCKQTLHFHKYHCLPFLASNLFLWSFDIRIIIRTDCIIHRFCTPLQCFLSS